MQEDEVLLLDHLVARLLAALPADADLQLAGGAALDLLDDVDLAGAVAPVEVIGEARVAFVCRLHQDVRVAAAVEPVGDVVDRGRLIEHALILAVVKELDHDDDAVVVGGSDHLVEAIHPGRLQRPVGVKAAHDPGMVASRTGRAGARTSALQPDRDHADAVLRIGGQHRHELVGVALRIPPAGIGVFPLAGGGRVLVVEDGLGHPGVEQEAFGRLAGRGPFAIDQKLRALDGHHGVAGARRGGGRRLARRSQGRHAGRQQEHRRRPQREPNPGVLHRVHGQTTPTTVPVPGWPGSEA